MVSNFYFLFWIYVLVVGAADNYIACNNAIKKAYEAPAFIKDQKDLNWCQATMKKYGVIFGRRWGPMSKEVRDTWSSSNCDELIKFNRVLTCNQRYGWRFFNYWLLQRYKAPPQESDGIECVVSSKENQFCRLTNVTLNFAKVKIDSSTRVFSPGFIETHGTKSTDSEPGPGHLHINTPSLSVSDVEKVGTCDHWETRPTFFLSNDDPFNLSHYYNEVIMIWRLVGVGQDSLLVNMDGIRSGGPSGGASHKLMVPNRPDEHGPFAAYFDSWFGQVMKASALEDKRVCYRELYFQYFPGYPWFWQDWSRDNECSYVGPSPLYQSFSLHMREQWRLRYGASSLPPPPTDHVHIVVELREHNKNKPQAAARVIANERALLESLRSIPNVKVTAKSFARMPFSDQVALAHSAGVYVGMHGAGTAHMFNSAVGLPNCCALVELFPDTTSPFHTIRGFGNLARHYGMHYYRYQASSGLSNHERGTTVEVTKVLELVKAAVSAVRTKPSCVNNATASSVGVLSPWAYPLSRLPRGKMPYDKIEPFIE